MRPSILISSAFLAAGVACGSTPRSSTTAPSPAPRAMAANLPERIERCPMRVRGTRVVAAPTAGGAALTFTTEGDVRELRARVREMAARHDRVMASGHRGTGVMHGQIGMPPARATVVDVEGGARLVFTPTDGAQADELRAAARRHAQRMQGGECPMESATTL